MYSYILCTLVDEMQFDEMYYPLLSTGLQAGDEYGGSV